MSNPEKKITYIYISIYVRMYIYIYTCVCSHLLRVYACMYAYMCVCIHIYGYIHVRVSLSPPVCMDEAVSINDLASHTHVGSFPCRGGRQA